MGINNWFTNPDLKLGYFRGKEAAYSHIHEIIYSMALFREKDFAADPEQTLTQLLAIINIHKNSARNVLERISKEKDEEDDEPTGSEIRDSVWFSRLRHRR